jgi:hypothetical protein
MLLEEPIARHRVMTDNLGDGSTVVVRRGDILDTSVANEAVMLDPENGMYYGANAVGSRLWELLEDPHSISELQAVLVTEFDVEPDAAERDLRTFLNDLAAENLIDVSPESAP